MATGQQIIGVGPDKKWLLNKEILEQILLRDEINNLPVVVISIVGTFRQGKSFILNFLLRFLDQTCNKNKSIEDWLSPADGPLSGFAWKNSIKKETSGIVMWSEVFISQLPSGDEVAIILLDTQGTDDNESHALDFANIFALSTLISSVQIYNLMNQINRHHLLSLKDFLGYGQLFNGTNSEGTPFQNLLFLIRDWVNPGEFNYGEGGGQDYLELELGVQQNHSPDATSLKTLIKRCFSNISGFLLPEPSSKVKKEATNNLEDMDDEFIKYVKLLVEKVLKPENLAVKKLDGQKLTVSDLCNLIERYWEIFQSGKIPRPESMLQEAAEVQHQSIVAKCMQSYTKNRGSDKNNSFWKFTAGLYLNADLKDKHEMAKKAALNEFNQTKKLGDEETTEKYYIQLTEQIDKNFNERKPDTVEIVKAAFTGLSFGIVVAATIIIRLAK